MVPDLYYGALASETLAVLTLPSCSCSLSGKETAAYKLASMLEQS